MIDNLQHELYQLEIKQTKSAKLCANIRCEPKSEKYSKTFSKVIERKNTQNQTISELYTITKNNLVTLIFFSQLKTFLKNYIPRQIQKQLQKMPHLRFLSKFLTKIKSQMNNFAFMRLLFL